MSGAGRTGTSGPTLPLPFVVTTCSRSWSITRAQRVAERQRVELLVIELRLSLSESCSIVTLQGQ